MSFGALRRCARASASLMARCRQRLPPRVTALPLERDAGWGRQTAAAAAAAAALLGAAACDEGVVGVRDASQLRALLESGADPNQRHWCGWTALHRAAITGDAGMVRELVEAGAEVDAADAFEPRAVRSAQEYYKRRAAREEEFSRLVDPGAGTAGFTALHYACLASSLPAVEALIAAGADPTLQDGTGHAAVEYTDDAGVAARMRQYAAEFPALQAEAARRRAESARQARRLNPLESRVKECIVGQEGPVAAVAAAVRRRENGWHDEEHPLVFLFLGSSGLGKTELAKQLALYIHGSSGTGFIRCDMSEFSSKHEAAKFIGSPPGYVGYEEGGQLTKMLEQEPNAVVLLDEVEKAHPDVLNLMLQLFDEGRITDGQGKTIHCKNAIFVMTSNLAADEIAEHGVALRRAAALHGAADRDVAVGKGFKDGVIRPILKGHFKRDEFLGRIDEVLYFLPFSDAELVQLVQIQLAKWAARAKERHKIELTWDPAVLAALSRDYDVHFGARSLQHAVDKRVVNRLARAHEDGELTEGGTAHLELGPDGTITVRCGGGRGSWF